MRRRRYHSPIPQAPQGEQTEVYDGTPIDTSITTEKRYQETPLPPLSQTTEMSVIETALDMETAEVMTAIQEECQEATLEKETNNPTTEPDGRTGACQDHTDPIT